MYFNAHVHSEYSNTRGFLDSTNHIKDLITYSQQLGYNGFALTDHDCLTGHIEALNTIKDFREKSPEIFTDFKIALGNEIYLCSRKEIEAKEYNFYHFILIAKDLEGHQQLRELSTRAWIENSFTYVNIRTPTYFEDLFEVISNNPGHLIGSTACLGGQLPKLILAGKEDLAHCWIKKMIKVFGEGNFFLELQPSFQEDQQIVNKALINYSKEFNIPYIITTDAHYLAREDRSIHEAFLNSNDSQRGERELGEFYATTFIQSEEDIHGFLDESLGIDIVNQGILNTQIIYNQITEYSLDKKLDIPYKAFDISEPDKDLYEKYVSKVPALNYFYNSNAECDRHMCRDLLNKMNSNPDEFENEQTYSAMEECLSIVQNLSEKQGQAWSGYLLVCKELIKTAWEVNSLVGVGRGSGIGFILLYMLDITQVNPLREETQTYPWRFLNPARVSEPDIDVDIQGSKKEEVLEALKIKFGGYRHATKVLTVLTCKSKSALLTAARGLGYTPEEGSYLASFIQAERGNMYTLKETFYGNDSGLKPNKEFVKLMTEKYPDVWEVAQKIEGLCTGIGSHAGGIILSVKELTNFCSLMKTTSGDMITSYDLHTAEQAGLIKYDLLAIDALEKIHTELDLLLKDGRIEWQGDLKSTYLKYLDIYKAMDRNNPEIWEMINRHQIISLFQFEKQSGRQAIELGQPQNLTDLTALNSVMRLMAQEGQTETPLQKYARFKSNIDDWYEEMEKAGLTQEEQEWCKKYCLVNYGFLPNQENFMLIVQDPKVGGWELGWADKLRKSIAKKDPKAFDDLEKEFFDKMNSEHLSPNLCKYVWSLISTNRGYSFNSSHTLSYSIIGLQEANLAYKYPIIYWNVANLITDSGGQDSTVRYDKIAAAVNRMKKEGIPISLPDINKAKFDFTPDAENNKIIYGLKPILGVGANEANAIIACQPYNSAEDFYNKMQEYKKNNVDAKFGDSTMIQLIKAGAFDEIEQRPREEIMADFLRLISKPLKSLSLSNIENLNSLGLLTPEQKAWELRLARYKSYIFKKENIREQIGKSPATYFYYVEPVYAEPYFIEHFINDLTEGKDYKYTTEGLLVKRGSLEKLIEKLTSEFKKTVIDNPLMLQKVNDNRFQEIWQEKAKGSVSKWEMDSLCMYYHEHELSKTDKKKYAITEFDNLNPIPEVVESYNYKGKTNYRYKLSRIAGTVISKDKNHSTVSLLTIDGTVVTVKFYKGQFSFYDRAISEVQEDGTKIVLENSWFTRGNKLLISGYRREDQFVVKKYKDSIFKHSVELIADVKEEGTLQKTSERVGEEEINAIAV